MNSELVAKIELTKAREEVIEQYKSDTNLKKRISIHDYSTADTEWFHWLFEREQINDLYVPDEELILNYVASYSEEASKLVNSDKESFYKHVQSKMDEDGYFFIHKSTGLVMCVADDMD